MDWLTGGDEARAALEAVLAGPEAVAEREASRLAYVGSSGSEAVSLAESVFGIQRPGWVAPGSEPGTHVERYLNSSEAVEATAGGQHVLVASSTPLLSSVGSGRQAPASYSLEERGGVYVPRNPLVAVGIAKDAAGGVSLPYGYAVAPVQAGSGEGSRVVGDRVVYPGSGSGTMFTVEAVPAGVEASWELLSQGSPSENALRFTLPAGASLRLSSADPGAAEVADEGQTVLFIPHASAMQADGVSLPVSYSVSGDVLATHVDLGGSVDFPVMVDPVIEGITAGSFGSYGAGTWPGWSFHQTACDCFGYTKSSSLLKVGEEGEFTNNEYGEWVIWAPGAGEEGGASITRVDVDGLAHQAAAQSYMNLWLVESNGKPTWTFNGEAGAMGEGPIWTDEAYSNYAATLCADGGGGRDKSENPLCNETYGAKAFAFADVLGPNARTTPNYVQITGAVVRFLDKTAPNQVTIEDIPNRWVKYGPTESTIYAHDQGTGIEAFEVSIPPHGEIAPEHPFFAEDVGCSTEAGFDGCPMGNSSKEINFSGIETGVWTLGVYGYDAVGNVREEQPAPHLYVDHTPPHMEALGGSLVESASKVGAGNYTLSFSAVDGSEAAPQSGVHQFTVAVDGTRVDEVATSCSEPTGVPAAACFGLSGSWTMEGERYGAGPHTVTVTAKDWAGNETTETLNVTVDEAGYSSVGPGSVNLQTGNFRLGATDVSVGGAGAALSVSRSYESRNLMAGSGGPLGPQWSLSLPDAAAYGVWRSLHAEPDGNVEVTLSNGAPLSFAHSGGGFLSPAGYQTETLKGYPAEKPSEYRLTNAAGDQTIFKHAEGEEEGLYTPVGVVQASGAGGLNKVTYIFQKTGEGIVEPTAVIAPSPAGVECVKELVRGCRELSFNYASSTTASGEGPEEWGDYEGRLTRIYLHAWNPKAGEKGEMSTTTVAQYAYDSRGRLRAEWNPQVTPALKTVYGYDAEGHVTALTAPGQETWAFIYGTIAGEANPGRLIKALQAPASTSLWKGEALANTEAPKLSGSPLTGVRMAITGGKWSGGPVAYAYRWEDCNNKGEECSVITGADNGNYTPGSKDLGYTILGQVIATNGGGTVVASTTPSAVVREPGEAITEKALGNEFECPNDIATGPESTVWFTDYCNSEVGKISSSFTTTAYDLTSAICLRGITEGPDTNMWAVEECASKIAKITSGGVVSKEYSLPTNSYPTSIVSGPNSELWFTDYVTSKIGKITTEGSITEYSLNEPSKYPGPFEITVGPEKTLWFTEYAGGKIGKMTTAGAVTEYSLPTGSKPFGITEGTDGNLWYTNYAKNTVGKITTGGTITEYALPSGSDPRGISTGPEGDLWFTEAGTRRVGQITTAGAISERTVGGAEPMGITSANDGSHLWFTEYARDAIGRIATKETETSNEGETVSPQPGWTVEYNVPISGGGAPHEMSSGEVAKWAQKDDPVSAAAILPPSESKPQGWPATSYAQATVYYLDSQERTVNLANPAGGISTIEYNDSNDNIERTLSADDRASALKEGSKSAEVAEHLSTVSTYNSEGTELTSTLGPEHKIKLPGASSEVQARKHTTYSYNEGAPSEGGPYYLVTKTVEAAKLSSGKEEDERVVKDAYSGQENLGWKLDEPTSTTTAAGGLSLTHTTLYSSTTGAEVETRSPGATGHLDAPYYVGAFGAKGSGSGQFMVPWDLATNSAGDVYVLDTGNNRVEEFTGEGALVREWGSYGSGNSQFNNPLGIAVAPNGDVYVTDENNNRVEEFTGEGSYIRQVGSAGSGAGQMYSPNGIAIDSSGNVWVADSGNSRVDEFNSEGTFVRTISGEGANKIKGAGDVAVDSKGNVWVDEDNQGERISEFTGEGSYICSIGSRGSGNGQLNDPWRAIVGPEGNIWVADTGNNRIEVLSATGEYEFQFGKAGSGRGEMSEPLGVAIHGSYLYVLGNYEHPTVQRWLLGSAAIGNPGAYDSQTIYYSSGIEAGVPACENHPEWANLVCQTQPAHQPEVEGLPELPVSSYTYNLYDDPEVTKSTTGGASRTETDGYDAAGRLVGKELSASVGASLPKVSYEYNKETGALEKQSAGEHTITSVYNTLGELVSYTDADEGVTTYKHDIDGRTTEEAGPYGTQTYSYNETTGLESKLVDSAAGSFTAGYDVEGNLVSERLPDGLTVCFTRNATGEATGLEYRKSTGCESGSVWFSDTVAPSIHGQWVSQSSSLSSENYAYDEEGRLDEVQETPAGKGCTVRRYGLEENGNRTSLITREPGSKGECATEGGKVQTHSYDTANQLTDSGTTYNAFGDITSLPAADAGGSTLESAYYADGQVAEQRQEEVTQGYQLDPARRTSEITTTSSKVDSTLINHYAGEGATPAWTTEPGGKWTRYIYGIGNGLAAIQTDAETPVLQLADLHGDIIGTAADEEAASKLLSSTNSTEYGVPTVGGPPRYSWLGTQELPTEFPSGVAAMGARSYVPQLGRFLQPDPRAGGSENAYAYVHNNPLNETDPSGQWALNQTSGGLSAVGTGEGTPLPGGVGMAANAVTPPPVNAQVEAAFWASPPWDQETAGNEEYEEYEYEEEGEEEWVSNRQGTEGHIESGVLVEGLASGEVGNALEAERLFSIGPCPACGPKLHKKHKSYKVRLRSKGGSWSEVVTTYCGIVGGAALAPGVDVFDAPVEVGCAGYGAYKAVEAIIEAL